MTSKTLDKHKHNVKNNTEQEEARLINVTAILMEEKDKRSTKPTHVTACFGTWLNPGVDSKDGSGSLGPVQLARKRKKRHSDRQLPLSHFKATTTTHARWPANAYILHTHGSVTSNSWLTHSYSQHMHSWKKEKLLETKDWRRWSSTNKQISVKTSRVQTNAPAQAHRGVELAASHEQPQTCITHVLKFEQATTNGICSHSKSPGQWMFMAPRMSPCYR